jgi:hypothetical protein
MNNISKIFEDALAKRSRDIPFTLDIDGEKIECIVPVPDIFTITREAETLRRRLMVDAEKAGDHKLPISETEWTSHINDVKDEATKEAVLRKDDVGFDSAKFVQDKIKDAMEEKPRNLAEQNVKGMVALKMIFTIVPKYIKLADGRKLLDNEKDLTTFVALMSKDSDIANAVGNAYMEAVKVMRLIKEETKKV